MTTRLATAATIIGLAAALGGCSSFAGFVADNWPHWAGGMPDDVPPRPGAPGYDQFIAHGKERSLATKPEFKPGTPEAKIVEQPPAAASQPPAATPQPFAAAPQHATPGTADAVKGGLY
jgi:hypothetical protein